jgi:uncharacterized membrane protein
MFAMIFYFGLFLVVAGLAMFYLGKEKNMNGIIGFRVPPTLRNPEIWKTVNIRMGVIMSLHGIFAALAGFLLPEIKPLLIFIIGVPLLIQMVYGVGFAYELEKRTL